MAQRISIVDYGMGNLRSVQKALAHAAPGAQVAITSDPDAIRSADRVVFPGQGAMPGCMRALRECGLGDAVAEAARERRVTRWDWGCSRAASSGFSSIPRAARRG